MNYHSEVLKGPSKSFVAAIAVFASALSGCSGEDEKREYAVPASLCGTVIDADELGTFLPAGRNITVRDKNSSGTKKCEVVVDDTLIVTTTQMWQNAGDSTAIFAYGQTLDTPNGSAEKGRFRYSGNEAFGKTRDCVDTKVNQALYTAIQARGSKHRDAEAMKRLIVSYTKEIEKSDECAAGASQRRIPSL